ncbi:MAG: ATP-binding protein [Anaerostipes sp.]|nr:ATP-binding protein [Anaerostipes sp.]
MPLNNDKYQEIMRSYEQTRHENFRLLQQRKSEIYKEIPRIEEIDQIIAHLAVDLGKKLIFSDNPSLTKEYESQKASLVAERTQLLEAHGYTADYLQPIYHCKDCKDTGYIGTNKCHCLNQAMIHQLYSSSNMEKLLAQDNFDHFEKSYYSSKTTNPGLPSPRQNIESVLEQCHKFISYFPNGENLLFTGSTGVGKTFLSHCIAKELMDQGVTCLYVTSFQLFEALADHTFRHTNNSSDISTDYIMNSDLMVIDDLGTELTNSFVNSQLFQCINERLLRQKSTIISTNLTLEQIRNQYSDRIFSRLVEGYSICKIYGEDIRFRKSFS